MGGLLVRSKRPAFARLQSLIQPTVWQQGQWRAMLDLGLTMENQEEWKYTPFERFNQLPFCRAQNQCIDNLSYEGLSIGMDCYRLVFFDGKFSIRQSDWIPNVKVTPLDMATSVELFEMSRAVKSESMALLTDATATTGVLIEVSPGVVLDKPIYLFHLNSGEVGEVCSYRHHIEVGRLASCELVEHHISLVREGGVSLSRLTANIGEGGNYNHSKLVEEGAEQHHFGHNDMVLQRDACAYSTTLMLEGGLNRHQTSSWLRSENGYVEMNSLMLPRHQQVFDSRTYLRHQSAHCQSRQTHKVIARDKSNSVFDGMIYVDKSALKTDGQMDNHNLILGDGAQVNTKPQLEIYADDVKCSHGATTGQLDKDQIDYMRARGIEQNKAKRMITCAFAADVANKIGNQAVQDYAHRRIHQILAEEKSND